MSGLNKNLFKVYKRLVNVAELQVKHYCPKINMDQFMIKGETTDDKIIKSIGDLTKFIRNPQYGYLYCTKK